ncbi:MAG: hypothetical protein CO187_02875 [Zetaproteobacteria bacterium CG_4_9_14_3_um_filter_53_7]|nr:MAG: hypothetical protein CO187_02875 [Zetaproteobacteria bacterium CG_4_9_14_3_um_filter_53_7]
MFEAVLVACISLVCLSIMWFTLRTGISPMPSSPRACQAMLKASEQAAEGTMIDLGSGWGTLVFALARKYPERRIIGYELSWLPWFYARVCKSIFRLHHVQLLRQDFLTAELPAASSLVCYLFPQGMQALSVKLAQPQYRNMLLVSSTFALPNKRPVQTIELNDLYHSPIYIYQL